MIISHVDIDGKKIYEQFNSIDDFCIFLQGYFYGQES